MKNSFRISLYSNVFLDENYLKSEFVNLQDLIFCVYISQNSEFNEEFFYDLKNGNLSIFLLDLSKNLNEAENLLKILSDDVYNSKIVIIFMKNGYIIDGEESGFQDFCEKNFKVIYANNQTSISKIIIDEYEIAKFDLVQLINRSLFVNNPKFTLSDFQDTIYPNAIALNEQKLEAYNAIELWNLEACLKHLQNALELKPLDFSANFFIAYVLLTKNSKKFFIKIKESLIKCISIAKKDGDFASYAICGAFLAKAYLMIQKQNECMNLLSDAKNSNENSAFVRYEMAKFLVLKKRFDEAKKEFENAFKFDINTLELIKQDPFFSKYCDLKEDLLQKENLVLNRYEAEFFRDEIKKENELKTGFNIENETKKSIFEQLNSIQNSLNQIGFDEVNSSLNKDEFIKYLAGRSKENLDFEDEKNLFKTEHLSKLEEINLKFYNNLTELKNKKTQSLKSFFLTIFLIFIIMLCLCLFLSQKNGGFHLGFFASINAIIIGIIMLGVYKISKKYNKLISLNKQNRQNTQEKLEDIYKENILEISKKQDKMLKVFYENIKTKLFDIKNNIELFENFLANNSISKTIFSNLENCVCGSIVLIDKDCKNYEIKEDFPPSLEISLAKTKDSFLAKVICKDQNKIILSRFGAYKD